MEVERKFVDWEINTLMFRFNILSSFLPSLSSFISKALTEIILQYFLGRKASTYFKIQFLADIKHIRLRYKYPQIKATDGQSVLIENYANHMKALCEQNVQHSYLRIW